MGIMTRVHMLAIPTVTTETICMTRDIEYLSYYSIVLSQFYVFFCMYFILCDMQSLSLVFSLCFDYTHVSRFLFCIVLCSLLLSIRIKHDEGVVLPTCSLSP